MNQIIFLLGSVIFKLLSIFPIKENRIILECDYGKGFYDNLRYIYNEINYRKLNYQIVIPLNKGVSIENINKENTKLVRTKSFRHLFYLATAKFWITNNHYYFFIKPRKSQCFINTWHALGAFKKFGLDSAKNKNEIKRFKKEGLNIHYLLVSSPKLKQIYSKALNVSEKKIISIGIPRTDILFNEEMKISIVSEFQKKYPSIINKKVILYAPTFRDHEKKSFDLRLDLNKLRQSLGEEYIVLLRLHPIISNEYVIAENLKKFVFNVKDEDINELLLIADMLITDYSSIVFEYSLLQKPIIFYAYDYENYIESLRGFYFKYEDFVPGPIAKDTQDIINIIKEGVFDLQSIKNFSNFYCEYKDGKSTRRFVDTFLDGKKC